MAEATVVKEPSPTRTENPRYLKLLPKPEAPKPVQTPRPNTQQVLNRLEDQRRIINAHAKRSAEAFSTKGGRQSTQSSRPTKLNSYSEELAGVDLLRKIAQGMGIGIKEK